LAPARLVDADSSADYVTLMIQVPPYATSGATHVAFWWQLGSSYHLSDEVVGAVTLTDVATGEQFDLEATNKMLASQIYLPIVVRQ
jgi:hypothetical protein